VLTGDRMRRREFGLALASLAGLGWTRVSAQSRTRLPKVAFLLPDAPDIIPANLPGPGLVLTALAELGYVDGQNVTFEFRFAKHALERLPALAAELVAGQPDVLYTYTSGGARAAAGATTTIPIVVAPVAEETMAALVPDFAHPARNITGLTLTSHEQHEKCLQLLKEAVPGIRRVGVLFNPLNPIWRGYPEALNDTARDLGLELLRVGPHGAADIDKAFAALSALEIDALYVLPESTLTGAGGPLERIIQLLDSERLPSVGEDTYFAHEGGLLSLGIDEPAVYPVAAQYIHRILQAPKSPSCRSCAPQISFSP
jgi:putative tryptophan/tyrosine transport system substrate-binding protein